MKGLTGDARVYGGVLWKLEPSELTEIRLPGFPKPDIRAEAGRFRRTGSREQSICHRAPTSMQHPKASWRSRSSAAGWLSAT